MKHFIVPDDMILKIISGEKTEDRQPIYFPNGPPQGEVRDWYNFNRYEGFYYDNPHKETTFLPPKYLVGEEVFVKETYGRSNGNITYKLAGGQAEWQNKMMMSQHEARICVKVTELWVNRLTQITEGSARREGVEKINGSYRQGFFQYWQSRFGEKSLLKNPWVWVIEFEYYSI